MKVIVVMRSLFIDRTIVKGYNENVYTEDGKVGSGLASSTELCFSPAVEMAEQRNPIPGVPGT